MLSFAVNRSESYKSSDKNVILETNDMMTVLFLVAYIIMMICWFNLTDIVYFVSLAVGTAMMSPHLIQKSKFYYQVQYPGIQPRPWSDKLVTTSMIYAVAGVYAGYYGLYNIALNCVITSCGSVMYHRHREAQYFNLDNVFASSMVLMYGVTLASSLSRLREYFLFGCLGLPVASYLLVTCGMPAEITAVNTDKKSTIKKYLYEVTQYEVVASLCCIRSDNPTYELLHTLWHLASGVGPIIAVVYVQWMISYATGTDAETWGTISKFYMPIGGIMFGGAVNAFGSIAGVFPVD